MKAFKDEFQSAPVSTGFGVGVILIVLLTDIEHPVVLLVAVNLTMYFPKLVPDIGEKEWLAMVSFELALLSLKSQK